MSSTNKTTNYELSQYIGSDKPTYLGDYNSDMLKIDAQMKVNSNNIASVSSTATTASETATTAISNASAAQTAAETAQTTATSANNTATTALNKANANEASITSLLSLFNLNDIEEYTGNNIIINNNSLSQVGTGTNHKITVATNSDGTIAKIYGKITGTTSATEPVSVSVQSNLRPSTNITINPMGTIRNVNNNAYYGSFLIDIDTNGLITFRCVVGGGLPIQLISYPIVIFVSDFGDVE